MKRYDSLEATFDIASQVLAIGFFDGFHRGHQAVLARAKAMAKKRGASVTVLTFYPHPMTVLSPGLCVPLLCSGKEKEELLMDAGTDNIICIRPTKEFLSMTVHDFMVKLSKLSGLAGIVTGENFSFGRGALGHAGELRLFFGRIGITVETAGLVHSGDGIPISSTRIRQCLQAGRIQEAEELLGHPYRVHGDVVHGVARGSKILGFPTANLALSEERVIPADGVYATFAIVSGRKYPAVTNVGKNPTFRNTFRTIETFIFNFDDSIYGQPFALEWKERIRGEIKFSGAEALKEQIALDVKKAGQILQALS